MKKRSLKQIIIYMGLLVALCAAPQTASALDGYRDRSGVMGGLGIGGGAVVQEGDTGGEMMLDVQIGGGATKNITFALDVDLRLQLVDGNKTGLLVPGPELTFFITDGLFVRAGIGLGMIFAGSNGSDDNFTLGFNGGGGIGYEFFTGADLALSMALEVDYFVIDNRPNVFAGGFWMGLRFY